MRRASKNAGMTLIEIMIVVAIIGLLSAIIGVGVVDRFKTSQESAALSQIRSFESALKVFRLDCGRYPTKAEGLDALVRKPSGCRAWRPILAVPQIPKDPWSKPYEYFEPGEHGQDVEVASAGPDGSLGSTDDLVSWTIDGRLEEQG
jgi:general secretion pathway protein G